MSEQHTTSRTDRGAGGAPSGDELDAMEQVVNEMDTARTRFYRDLIDRVAADRYPSSTQLDLIEANLPVELYQEYTQMLIERLDEVNYPSLPMLQRVQRMVNLQV